MTVYYVSSQIGSNQNAGTSASAPLASLQAAANLVRPGDTVQVMNGTYTAPGYGDALDITTSGTASAPITFEAAPGQTPVINSSGGWQAINIQASYIVVSGFTVVGDAANYNLQSALAGYSTGNANLDGNGISVNTSSSVPLPNHITIENNTVYNEPGNGIDTLGADYVQILNNVVHNNANWSPYGNSGISVYGSKNLDTNSGPHIVISGNLSYDNAQLVPTNYSSTITDGEGIILDTNTGYTGGFLVQNNTVYGNGGPGVETFQTSGATITGNTIYGNNTGNVQAASNSQIFINYSSNITATDNTLGNGGTAPTVSAPVISSDVVNSNDSVTLTGTAPDGATVTVSDGGANPLGTATASSTGAWNFTTVALSAATYAFTATETTTLGTSGPSSPLSVTVPPVTVPPPATPVAADILWQNVNGQPAIWEVDNGTNVIGNEMVGYNPGPSWTAVGMGDFNDDGHSDILWQNASTGQASIWELNGTNVIGNQLVGAAPGPSWKAIGTGDFYDNGYSDILWQNTSTGQASIWEMNGTNVIGGGLVGAAPGPSWTAIGTGDFNDDGHSDILWQNTSTGQVSIWEMNGTNVIGNQMVGAAPGPNWKAIGTGDFNDDGHSDILWQNTSTGQVSIWEMNGTNVIGSGVVGTNPGPNVKAIGTGDFSGDGYSDGILFQNTSTGQVSVWEMNGTNIIGGGLVGAAPGASWLAKA
jgi:parallel beta-helix repeat protein